MKIKKQKNKRNSQKSRKQLRKEARKNKKLKRHEYYTNRRKPGQFVLINKNNSTADNFSSTDIDEKVPIKLNTIPCEDGAEKIREKEKRQQKKLQKEMNKQRNKQLIEANAEEDRNIKHLEKQLKLNKRKSKSVPKSFAVDGLDYLLEVCDPETMKSSALAEQQLTEFNDEFEEDLALMTNNNDQINENEGMSYSDDSEVLEENAKTTKKRSSEVERNDPKRIKKDYNTSESEDLSNNNDSDKSEDEDNIVELNSLHSIDSDENSESDNKKNEDETWEDIYGRLRAKDGSIIKECNNKYIPPAARLEVEISDKPRIEKLERLKKQMKGLMNRLAESNMHSILSQIEELFMKNSRNDMNNTIANLVVEALVSNILAPERLLMEHVMLIIVLHANIGTEVGAHFLQTVVKYFDEELKNNNVEDKKLDNLVIILAQLYNFKLFDSKLIYEIINKLVDNFEEKDVECILHVLRNVGFNLRKDDPIALKTLILNLQKKASNASDDLKNNSRVKFMLDILLAIKNNNVSKIPNYDTTYSEHLKKIMKGFIRKGNYVSQLNISLEDLVKAEEKGKWWIVGSAWTGNISENNDNKSDDKKTHNFSQDLLELAKKQRMNTDTRKNIFCIIMSSEDYLDAFEKLLRLSLKNQEEREIIHVILHCCLQEKKYNPFYAILAQKFCEHDRRHQMTIKYSIWDKLKTLNEHSAPQISNLAKLLSHLLLEKGLPISVLKIVQFSELDKVTLRFMRQILLRILLHEDLETCKEVFEKLRFSEKLKMFRESLKLFIYHFLLRNLKSQDIPDDKAEFLKGRVKAIEKILT